MKHTPGPWRNDNGIVNAANGRSRIAIKKAIQKAEGGLK
jgi:hypothetical protein